MILRLLGRWWNRRADRHFAALRESLGLSAEDVEARAKQLYCAVEAGLNQHPDWDALPPTHKRFHRSCALDIYKPAQ